MTKFNYGAHRGSYGENRELSVPPPASPGHMPLSSHPFRVLDGQRRLIARYATRSEATEAVRRLRASSPGYYSIES